MLRRIQHPLTFAPGASLSALALLLFLLHGPLHHHGPRPDTQQSTGQVQAAGCAHPAHQPTARPAAAEDSEQPQDGDAPRPTARCPLCLMLAGGGLLPPVLSGPLPAPRAVSLRPFRAEALPPAAPLLTADAAPRAPPLLFA